MDGWIRTTLTHGELSFPSFFYYAQYGYVDGRTFGRHRHRHRFHTEEYPLPPWLMHIQMVYTIHFFLFCFVGLELQ